MITAIENVTWCYPSDKSRYEMRHKNITHYALSQLWLFSIHLIDTFINFRYNVNG